MRWLRSFGWIGAVVQIAANIALIIHLRWEYERNRYERRQARIRRPIRARRKGDVGDGSEWILRKLIDLTGAIALVYSGYLVAKEHNATIAAFLKINQELASTPRNSSPPFLC